MHCRIELCTLLITFMFKRIKIMPNLCASLFKLMCSNVVCHHNNHLYLMDISKVYNVICKKNICANYKL